MCEFIKHSTGAEMPIVKYKEILEQLKDARLHGQAFTTLRLDGNRECLLYKRLGEAVKLAKQKGFFVYFVSNGLLLHSERAIELLELGVDYIYFSVTGTTPEVYQSFQGYGMSKEAAARQLQTVIENVSNFAQLIQTFGYQTGFEIKYFLTEQTVPFAYGDMLFWRNKGASKMMFCKLFERVETQKSVANIVGVNLRCVDTMLITTSGELLPCCHETMETSTFSLGNVFVRGGVRKILSSEQYESFLYGLCTHDGTLLPDACIKCPYMDID
jgi:radical SAM protein with 4Fe4S-binding SPASM domain